MGYRLAKFDDDLDLDGQISRRTVFQWLIDWAADSARGLGRRFESVKGTMMAELT